MVRLSSLAKHEMLISRPLRVNTISNNCSGTVGFPIGFLLLKTTSTCQGTNPRDKSGHPHSHSQAGSTMFGRARSTRPYLHIFTSILQPSWPSSSCVTLSNAVNLQTHGMKPIMIPKKFVLPRNSLRGVLLQG